METIELKKGDSVKIIGQTDTFLVVVNVNGNIFTRIDYKREEDLWIH